MNKKIIIIIVILSLMLIGMSWNIFADGEFNYNGNNYGLRDNLNRSETVFYDGSNWFIGEETNGIIAKYYSNWTYTGTSYSISSQNFNVKDIYWNGSNWFMLAQNTIYLYNSTWGYSGTSYDISAQDTSMQSIYYYNNSWYGLGSSNDKVFVYNSTWGYSGTSYDISAQDTDATDIFINNSFWYILGNQNNKVFKYNISFSLQNSFDLITDTTNVKSFYLNGTIWNILDRTDNKIYEFVSTNPSPSINNVTFTPSIVYSNDTINWFCNATDYNQDSLNFYWKLYLNNTLNSSGNIQSESIWDYTGTSYDVSAQNLQPNGIYWDGSNWFMAGYNNPDTVFVYNSTWGYSGTSYDISAQISVIFDIHKYNNNWYAVDYVSSKVFVYNSTWGYSGTSYDVSAQDPTPSYIYNYNNDWYLIGSDFNTVFVYNSTWNYTGTSYNLSNRITIPRGLYFDGTYWWIGDRDTSTIFKYFSNFVYTGINYTQSEDSSMRDIFQANGYWWMVGTTNDNVYQYVLNPSTYSSLENINIHNLSSSLTSKNQNWTLSCLVNDGNTNSSWYNSSILTISNLAPAVSSLNISPTSPNYLSNLTFINTTTDIDGDSIIYQWKWYKDGVEQSSLENQSIITYGNISVGENWTISLRAYDGTNWGSYLNSSTVTIVDNVSPIIQNDTLSASSGNNDASFIIYVDVTDQSNISFVTVQVTDPNSIASNFSMSTTDNVTYSKTYTPSTDGTYTFKFYAGDIYGNNDSLSSNLTYVDSTSAGGGGGGGGGGETTINIIGDDINKSICDIQIIPASLNITSNNEVYELLITNNEDFNIDPKFNFEYVSGDKQLTDLLRVTNIVDNIEGNFQAKIGVKLNNLYLTGNGEANFIMSTTKCRNIIVPINISITETKTVDYLFQDLTTKPLKQIISDAFNEAVFGNPIKSENIFKNMFYYLDSVGGITSVIVLITIVLLLPIGKHNKASRIGFIDIGIRIFILLIVLFLTYIIVKVLAFFFQT